MEDSCIRREMTNCECLVEVVVAVSCAAAGVLRNADG